MYRCNYNDLVDKLKDSYFDVSSIKNSIQNGKGYRFILSTLGIEMDNWGYVKTIRKDGLLYQELELDDRLKKVQKEILEEIKKEFIKEFDSRRVKIKRDFIKKAKDRANEQIINALESEILDQVVDELTNQVNTSELVKELKIREALRN